MSDVRRKFLPQLFCSSHFVYTRTRTASSSKQDDHSVVARSGFYAGSFVSAGDTATLYGERERKGTIAIYGSGNYTAVFGVNRRWLRVWHASLVITKTLPGGGSDNAIKESFPFGLLSM